MTSSTSPIRPSREQLGIKYRQIRQRTVTLCDPLSPEDMVVQAMPDTSPAKWHLAHTTWFFECFLLQSKLPDYQPFDPQFNYLFNSYYNAIGERHPRPARGVLTRPSIDDVLRYRDHVDQAMRDLLSSVGPEEAALVEVGLNHEQQHQELLLTDVLYLFSQNPLYPAYDPASVPAVDPRMPQAGQPEPAAWVEFDEAECRVGYDGDSFCFDNELPRHEVRLRPFRLQSRLVNNADFMEFILENGYERPEFWLADGWDTVRQSLWQHPLHWVQRDGRWFEFTLRGLIPIRPTAPVCHLSFYEADAFARWKGRRLPSEWEWEHACQLSTNRGTLFEDMLLLPVAPSRTDAGGAPTVSQLIGDVWEWTSSPYLGYPGYRPNPGALGEYNGKFMCNQFVLRGGSCVTPKDHIRRSYRNFFPPSARWQFMGFRLADDDWHLDV